MFRSAPPALKFSTVLFECTSVIGEPWQCFHLSAFPGYKRCNKVKRAEQGTIQIVCKIIKGNRSSITGAKYVR